MLLRLPLIVSSCCYSFRSLDLALLLTSFIGILAPDFRACTLVDLRAPTHRRGSGGLKPATLRPDCRASGPVGNESDHAIELRWRGTSGITALRDSTLERGQAPRHLVAEIFHSFSQSHHNRAFRVCFFSLFLQPGGPFPEVWPKRGGNRKAERTGSRDGFWRRTSFLFSYLASCPLPVGLLILESWHGQCAGQRGVIGPPVGSATIDIRDKEP